MPVTQPARMKLTPKQLKALRIVEEGRFFPTLVEEEDGWYARWCAVGSDEENQAVDGWVDEFVREAAMTRLTEDAEDQKHETLHDAWMAALKSRTGLVRWDPAACRAFASDLEEWSGYADGDVIARKGVVFRLRFACDGNVASPLTGLDPRGRDLPVAGHEGANTIFIHAKCDLARGEGLNVSSKTGEGLEELKRRIVEILRANELRNDGVDTPSERAMSVLLETRRVLSSEALSAPAPDLVLAANALRQAAESLGTLVGATYSSDLMDSLFSRFCVGK